MAYTSPFDVPDDDPEFQAFKTQFLGSGQKTNTPGFTTGIKQGLGGFVSGVGQVADDMGWKDNAIKRYGSEVQANNPSSAASQSWEGFKESPWQGIKEIAGQGVGSTLPSLAAFALPGGQAAGATGLARVGAVARGLPAQTALAAAPIYGSVREDQQRQGFDDIPSAAAAAIGGGIVESKLGIQRFLGQNTTKPLQEFVGQLASTPLKTAGKTWLRTGLEEGAEELVQQPMQQLGAHRNPLTEESLKDTAWSGFGGVIGGLAMGGIGGAKMGLAHKGVNDFRQRDLLNPGTNLDELDDQAKWNQAFVERDQGVDAGNTFYDQRQKEIDDYIESLVPQFREEQRQKVIDLLSNQKQADFDLEASVEGNDVIGEGFNPYNLAGSVSGLTQIDPIQPDLFANIDNPFTGESDAVSQVAQGSNQVQGGNSVGSTGAVGLGNSATGQRDGLGITAVAPAGPSGTTGAVESASGGVGAVTPESLRQQFAITSTAKPVTGLLEDIAQRISNGSLTAEQVAPILQKTAAAKGNSKAREVAVQEYLALVTPKNTTAAMNQVAGLPPVQQKVYDHILAAVQDNRADDVIGADGVFKATTIANALGIKKAGSVTAAISGMRKHLEHVFQNAPQRKVDAPDINNLGLSPAKQNSVVNEVDLFGNAEAGAEQNMGIINSIGGSQGETEGVMSGQEQLTRQADAARARGADLPSNDDLLAMVRQADRTKNDVASGNVQTAEEKSAEYQRAVAAKNNADLGSMEILLNSKHAVAAAADFEAIFNRPFTNLTLNEQAEFVQRYDELLGEHESFDAVETALIKEFNDYGQVAAINGETGLQDASGIPQLGSREGAEGTGNAIEAKQQPAVTTKKRRIAKPEEGVTKFSEGKTDQGIEPQKLAATLRKYFFSPEKFNKLVSIFPNAEALPADVKAAAAADAHMSVNDVPWEEVQGFAMNGKVYLVASNIKEGNELGVFLHELGVHVGMERLIGKSNMAKLSSQIEQWAARDDKSQETTLAKDAVRRAEGSASEDRQQEVIAYFVEEAVKAGINPVAVQKTNSQLAQWFRSLWAAAKLALRKIGFGRFDQLTAQNIVDLSYGAAKMELTGTWHGTAADFRNFNDKNIQRVASQVGANRDKVKFSQADITKTNPQYRQASTLVKQLIEYAGNKLQSLENNLMFGHQLGEKLQRLMPGTASYIKSVQNRQTERVKHEQEIARIANLYNELDTKQQNALNSFVQKSTMDGKWGFKPTWFEKDVQTEVDATAKTQFDALSPEAQQVTKDMFKFGSEQQKRFDESVNANIDDPKQKVQRNQMYGKPYAPLKRFGDHVVVGKSAQFLAEEKENPGGKRLEEMKADENHYYVEFTDGNLEAIQRRDKMAAANPNLAWESKPLQLEAKALNSVNFTVLEKLKKQIEASDNKSTEATKGALKSLANQLYIQQLNQLHANKSQAQRLNVKGADTDMMRAFVTQGRAEAALIANLRTHAETEAALQQIQKAAREGYNQDTKTRIANAVLRRHLAMLDFKPTPIQNKLMGLNSFYMLLTSPAYYLTNSTQPFVVTLPYMAGRFGGANSWNTLRDAYKTTLELVKLSTLFKDQNLDTTHLKKFDSVGRESEALQTLLDENLVNVGMEMELGDIANQSKNPTWKHVQKGMQVLKTGVANVEVLNRLSSAVAGYRLAYTEAVNNKLSPEDAHNAGVEYARNVIIDTHGDYAGYNAPTVMMQGAFGNLPVKLMTQFKKFQFIQAGLLIGTFRDAYMRGNLNNTEKDAARAMFKWMLGTQAALAGALGGVTGIPMAILGSMAAGAFGDDGEDKEAYLRRILGGGAFAQLILHGAPAAAGVDISKRVGMGAALDPFRMADPQTDWSDYALSIAGPSAGLASRFGSGMSYLGKGQYWKGLEMMMPSGVITNASKVARYESEGLTNSRGDVVMKPEEVSLMTDLMQSFGLETTQLSDRRWKAEAVYDRGVHFKEKTSQLQRDYVEAVKDQDQSALNEIRKGWMELQAERVKQGFKRENMSTLTHAPMAQKKRERDTVHGLQSTATNKKFVQSIDGL